MEERVEKLYNDYKSLTKSEKIEFFSIIEEDSKLIREEIELEKMTSRFELVEKMMGEPYNISKEWAVKNILGLNK